MRLTNIAAAFAAGILLLAGGCAQQAPVIGTAFVMDTILEYKLFGAGAKQAGEEIERALADFEARVSLYQKDSEISRLNDAAGSHSVALSPDVYELLSLCVRYGEESEGVFDVTVAPLALAWDITSEQPRVPSRQEIDQLLPLVNYRDIQLDEKKQSAMLTREGQMIDLGGIAKGYACTIARRAANEHGVKKGYISIGGNLMVMGKKSLTEQFLFGVRDPRGSANDFMGVISLPEETMATSGDYERYFEQDGVRYHHILDPATGFPAQSDLLSVSVISPDGAYADFMSTFLFIKGRDYALSRIDSLDCGIILIDRDFNVSVSARLKKQFSLSDPSGRYRYEGAQ